MEPFHNRAEQANNIINDKNGPKGFPCFDSREDRVWGVSVPSGGPDIRRKKENRCMCASDMPLQSVVFFVYPGHSIGRHHPRSSNVRVALNVSLPPNVETYVFYGHIIGTELMAVLAVAGLNAINPRGSPVLPWRHLG
jgi:hypothetical protein